jgi:hypothetical protein
VEAIDREEADINVKGIDKSLEQVQKFETEMASHDKSHSLACLYSEQ